MTLTSSYTESVPQVDGRRYVTEKHVTPEGLVYQFEWLGDMNAEEVVAARAAILNQQLQEKRDAEEFVEGTSLPLTPLDYMRLFTIPEEAAIRTLAKTNVTAEILLNRMLVAKTISLKHPETLFGINYLVAAGILTPERGEEILNG